MRSDPIDLPRSEPLGRRARKAMAVRQSLFAAGLAAFEREPIGLVSILDVTEAADVAKGVFYLHFRSKDEYLLQLWEDVQRRILDDVLTATSGCRSRAARIEAAVRSLAGLFVNSPRLARFWSRMSSYFPDEVGAPGHLTRIRRDYVRELAAILAGATTETVTEQDTRAALLVDSICWAVVRTSELTGDAVCDDETLVRIVASAVKALGRDAGSAAGGR